MKHTTINQGLRLLAAALIAVAALAGSSFAQATVNLCATTGSITMPDGASIPIWGFVDTGGAACAPGLANSLPGPVLRPAPGSATLTVNLTNALSEPVSFYVPGLRPTATTGTAGRFTAMAPPGGTASYTFTLRPGTFLYQSATDRIRTHVPMGLYGALVVDPAAGTAYAGVGYDADQILVFSSIDPNLNANPAGFDGAKVINWNPQYFLINGKASPNTDHLAFGTGNNVLLRLINAGLETAAPTLEGGLYVNLIAEDANLYPHRTKQYGIELPAGKTVDALINVSNAGTYALYDRMGQLTTGQATGGGMLTYLDVSAGTGIFELASAEYSVAENVAGGILTVTVNRVGGSAGAVSVDYATADVSAAAGSDYAATSGSLNFADGVISQSFDIAITDDSAYEGNETFTVSLLNPVGAILGAPSSAVITINEDDAGPGVLQFSAAAYSVAENAGTITVTVNRVDGSVGVVSVDYATANQSAAAGSDYTAANGTLTFEDGVVLQTFNITISNDGNYEGEETFTVSLSNPVGAILGTPSSAVVTINNEDPLPNIAPVANDDVVSAPRNSSSILINVIANDVDPAGAPIDPSSVFISTGDTSQYGGTVVNNGNGTVTYTPRRGFRGTDTFQYNVKDSGTPPLTSNTATVRVNVQ